MQSNKNPLVSITVITYNSAKYVIETLESAKAQTYQNIELIISDDHSTDNTVKDCQQWIEKNKEWFIRTELITIPENTGVSANCNRGIKAAHGEWVAFIAGDDALLPHCIEDNMDYVLNHPDVKVLYSYNKMYKNEFKKENFLRLNPPCFPTNIISAEISAHGQYKLLLAGDKIPFTPSLFLNRDAIWDAGLPDEDLFSEDYQTKLKLTKKGYKLYFMEKETVLYRQHDNASNNTIKEYILKPHYFKTENFRIRYIYPHIPMDIRLSHKYSWMVNKIFKIDFFNEMNEMNKFIFYVLNVVLNPFKYIIYFKSHYIAKYKNNVFYQ